MCRIVSIELVWLPNWVGQIRIVARPDEAYDHPRASGRNFKSVIASSGLGSLNLKLFKHDEIVYEKLVSSGSTSCLHGAQLEGPPMDIPRRLDIMREAWRVKACVPWACRRLASVLASLRPFLSGRVLLMGVILKAC